MNQVKALTRKEFSSYLNSPVALIFLATFLLLTLFSFFFVEKFFQRNLADLRPLFNWMPVGLIFIVSALTMRSWAEEHSQGTLELLFTWPIQVPILVLGKFLSVMALVAVALALTLAVPLSVSWLGDLDWGPMVTGYVGSFLVAGVYAAMGLWVSALTRNQIVALIVTGLLCGFFYILGSPVIVDLSQHLALSEWFRGLGTGSRFESIARGVLDMRDVVYYLSLTAFFLTLNTFTLLKLRWSETPAAGGARLKPQHQKITWELGLLLINLVVLNLWLAPITTLRLDLTARQEYTISSATRNLLRGLEEPLLIRFYSSETHPKLEPLRPQIRDLIKEYQIVSRGRVVSEFVDPTRDENVEREAAQDYGIKAVPFQIPGRHENKIVSSYFNILIKYGDKSAVLGFDELIEVNVSNYDTLEVKLRNLEYDLTKTIKKVVYGFQGMEEIFAGVKEPLTAQILVTQKSLPENLRGVLAAMEKVYGDLANMSHGKFSYQVIDLDQAGAPYKREFLMNDLKLLPFQASPLSQTTFYLHTLLMRAAAPGAAPVTAQDLKKNLVQVIYPTGDLSEKSLKDAIEGEIKKQAPGFLKTVGLWSPPPSNISLEQQLSGMDGNSVRLLTQALEANYQVKTVDLSKGSVDKDIDILLVVKPKAFGDLEMFTVDQFLMTGGTVIVASGAFEMVTQAGGPGGGGLDVAPLLGGLQPLLAHHGITLSNDLVMDMQNEPFPVPVVRDVGGFQIRDIQLLNYPFFVDVRPPQMLKGNAALAGLPAVTLNWASSLSLNPDKLKSGQLTPLFHSSAHSWTQSTAGILPDFKQYPKVGFAVPSEFTPSILAVATHGELDSYFNGKGSPLTKKQIQDEKSKTKSPAEPMPYDQFIKHSPESARLVVIGSGDFIDDKVLAISRSTGQDRYVNNLQLVQNLIDWSLEDTDLLSIRSRGSYARTLRNVPEGVINIIEYGNYGVVVIALLSLAFYVRLQRKRVTPIAIEKYLPSTYHKSPMVTEEVAA